MADKEPEPDVWPTFKYNNAKAAIKFLQDAFGFELSAEYTADNNPNHGDHAELRWPEGGGVMLRSVREDETVMSNVGVAAGSVYVVTDKPDEVYQRAVTVGAKVVAELSESDYGSRDFSVQDPEGVLWNFGTYRGAPS